MKKQFQSLTEKGRWLIATLTLLFTLGVGQMWADTEIFSWTATSALAKNASADATGGTVQCTGSAMGSETPSGSGFYKFNSSTQLTFTLSSGTFAAGDVISFTFTSGGNNKTVGVDIQEVSTQLTETVATKGTSVSKSYTVVASDGIQGQNKFSIKRVDSNFSFKSVSVTRASSGGCTANPAAPTKLEAGSITENSVTFSITDAADAGKYDLYYSMSSTAPASTATATATSTAKTKEITGLTASTEYYAWVRSVCDDSHKSAWVALTGGSFTTAAPDPCNKYFYFTKAADATTAGVTNNEGGFFTVSASGSNGTSGSIILDGKTYNCTNRTSNVSAGNSLATFTIPANKKGDLYGLLMSSGDGARGLLLDGVSTGVSCEGGTSALHNIVISNITSGTHTLTADGNARVGMFIMKVCDAEYHTITLDLDGGTGATSIQALDGAPATKPADPTKAHCAFAGWVVKSTSAAYDWAANVTGDLTLKATWTQLYTVTFANGGGSGDAPAAVADKAQGETFAVPANTFTAPEGKEFDKWNDGTNDYAPGATYTVGTANVTLTAVWKQLVAKYTVIFKDGETELGTKLFDVASNPSDADINKTKPLFTFAAWQKDNVDIALDAAFWATVVKDATVTLTARWAKAYATSYDMEAYAVSDGASKSGLETALTAAGYAYTNINGIDNGHTHNYTYDGMKYKTNDGDLSFNVVAGKVVEVKTGHLPSNDAVTMYINGVADATVFEGADENIETHKTNYFYSAAEALYRLDVKASKGTCAVKAVTIRDPYQVTFNVAGGDPVSAQYGHPSITLPSASKGTDSFLGWFIGEDKIGEAGDSYTPTANVELVAHWEAVSSDARLSSITFSSNAGTLSPAFDPEVTAYTYTMPYPTAAIPTITGATSVNANAQDPIIGEAATAWGGTQTVQGVAQSGDKKTYTITMQIEPKDGVCLVWADATGNSAMTVDEGKSLFAATAAASNTKNTATYGGKTGYKFNSRPANMSVTLSEETFQENDVVEVFVTQLEGADKLRVFTSNDDAAMLKEEGNALQLGVNKLTLPTTSTASLYLRRSAEGGTYAGWNPFVAYIAVYRAMMPKLTEMTIDGRTVTINEDAKTATVTIPYESDLANLTIAKTIIWNAPAATNSIVVNDGSAWVIGENTYKLTDKDGDATTYTITVARDVLKHTVSFNTHGGSAVASVEVEHNAYLTAVPNDPSKEDYIFQYWSLTDGGEEVDVTTVQINEDKEFHAVWVSDGGIKLINKTSGAVNEDGYFITGVTATEANSEKAAAWGGTQGATISGTNQLNKVVQYNATTNQTKLQIKVYNTNNSDKYVYIHKIIEGNTTEETVETLTATSKTVVTSEYYEFNNTKNRSFYITTNSTDVKILQVKVIEDGATPMKKAGEAGYSLNLNKGRALYYANSNVTLEGLALQSASNYNVISSTEFQTTKNFSFSISTPVLLKVTTNTAKYYVSQDPDEDGTTATAVTVAGTAEFNLTTTGTWYLVPSTTSNVKYTKIAFEAPKCEKPVFGTMSDIDLCAGDAFTAIDGTATVSDGGVVSYKWYKEGSETVLGTAATYTPSADGNYYVVATNSLADHQDNSATSEVVTVEHFDAAAIVTAPEDIATQAGQEKTLTIVASGANLHYVWYTCDDAEGTNPVAIVPAQTTASLTVTVPDGVQYYKVAVTDDCGADLSAVVKVEGWTNLPQVDVTASTVWDMTNVSASEINLASMTPSKQNERLLLANIEGVNNNASFNSQALMFEGQRIGRTENNVKYVSGQYVQFNVTVPGMVSVTFASNGSAQRTIQINGKECSRTTTSSDYIRYDVAVEPGSVEIEDVQGYVRISKIEFKAEDSYHRTVNPSYLGTLCWTNDAVLGGATLYVFAGKNENNYLVFDEVEENRLEAGKPYIFMPENGNTEIKLYNTDNEAALTEDQAPVNNMYGTITGKTLVPGVDDNMYYFSSNHIWAVKDFAVNIPVPAYYCYVDYAAVLAAEPAPAPAPGRRRVTMGVKGEQVATGFENLNASEKPVKLMINGQMFILRGEKLYDATGRLVK